MKAVIEERGSLGFNAKVMIEMGEENGSAGVHQIIEANKEAFAADVFIGSDGPRVRMDRPTMYRSARAGRRTSTSSANCVTAAIIPETGAAHWPIRQRNAGPCDLRPSFQPDRRDPRQGMAPPADVGSHQDVSCDDVELDGGSDGPEIDPELGRTWADAGGRTSMHGTHSPCLQ